MLCRVEDQRRVEHGEAERRKDLNEKERGRPLRSPGKTAFEKFHPASLCRPLCWAMSRPTYQQGDFGKAAEHIIRFFLVFPRIDKAGVRNGGNAHHRGLGGGNPEIGRASCRER